MIHLTLDEFKALYSNYYVHAFNGRILHKLHEFNRPIISAGAAHFVHAEDPNIRLSIKLGKDGEVFTPDPVTKKFKMIGRLVNC